MSVNWVYWVPVGIWSAWALINLTGSNPLEFHVVEGASMRPAAEDGSVLLVCTICPPRRGDIVLVENNAKLWAINRKVWKALKQPPQLQTMGYFKRVQALAGEPIPSVNAGEWAAAGHPEVPTLFAPIPKKVPAQSVWVRGDNTLNSIDSRFWGSVPLTSLGGTAYVIWR